MNAMKPFQWSYYHIDECTYHNSWICEICSVYYADLRESFIVTSFATCSIAKTVTNKWEKNEKCVKLRYNCWIFLVRKFNCSVLIIWWIFKQMYSRYTWKRFCISHRCECLIGFNVYSTNVIINKTKKPFQLHVFHIFRNSEITLTMHHVITQYLKYS